MTYKIAGCAGHGGFGVTPGKRTPDGEYEWDFNNKVILAFEEALKQYEGVEFLRTDDRTGHTDVPLQTRTDKANNWGANIYISFHHNANTGQWGNWGGTEVETYGSGESLKLGKLVYDQIMKVYCLTGRGVKDDHGLWIIRKTKMPAILIEGGFMDSTIDIKKLRDDSVLHAAGYAVAEGVAAYAGLKKTIVAPPVQPAPVQQPSTQAGTFRIKIIPSTLWYYDKPDWNAKKATVKAGEVFTVVETLTVEGSKMYKLKSGNYITANPQYVQVI